MEEGALTCNQIQSQGPRGKLTHAELGEADAPRLHKYLDDSGFVSKDPLRCLSSFRVTAYRRYVKGGMMWCAIAATLLKDGKSTSKHPLENVSPQKELELDKQYFEFLSRQVRQQQELGEPAESEDSKLEKGDNPLASNAQLETQYGADERRILCQIANTRDLFETLLTEFPALASEISRVVTRSQSVAT